MEELLFKTRHGSHLYGLNHADSDEDFYTVVRRPRSKRQKYAKHTIVDGIDTMKVDLPTWLRLCEKGVPQALEAMFAPNPLVDNIPWLRAGYRAWGAEVRGRYHRTIESFIFVDSSLKKKRHALRLALNLQDLRRYGRFNPQMHPGHIAWANFIVKNVEDEERLLDIALKTAYRMED